MGPGGGSGKTGERAAAPSSTSPRADIIPGRLMPFAYYDRLSARGQAIYRRSDRVSEIRLPHPEALRDLVGGLRMALESGDRKAVEVAAGLLGRGLTPTLDGRPGHLPVRPRRP